MLTRQVDFLKGRGVTAIFTSVSSEAAPSQPAVADRRARRLVVLLGNVERTGQHKRVLCVLKSRGMAHTDQIREFRLTDDGVVVDAGPHEWALP